MPFYSLTIKAAPQTKVVTFTKTRLAVRRAVRAIQIHSLGHRARRCLLYAAICLSTNVQSVKTSMQKSKAPMLIELGRLFTRK